MTTIALGAPALPVPEVPGDPASARALGESLISASGLLDEREGWMTADALAMTRDGTWTGPASEGYAAYAADPAGDARTGRQALRSAAGAAWEYADRLVALTRRRDDLDSARTYWNGELAALAADVRAAGAEVSPGRVADLRARAAEVRGGVDGIRDAAARLRADTRAAETAFTRALDSYRGLERSARTLAAGADPALGDALDTMPPGTSLTSMSAEQAASWWDSLTPAEQAAVTAAFPEQVGARDGLPAAVRDTANRLVLAEDLDTLGTRWENGDNLTTDELEVLDNARSVQASLDALDDEIDPITGRPLVGQLLVYEPGAFGGDGRAALAVGDLDAADHVAFNVPGLSTDLSTLPQHGDSAFDLYHEARQTSPDETVASVAWLGYDAPSGWDSAGVVRDDDARDGGALLARDVAGYRASRGDDQPHLTVIGHSYGSTTTALSATENDLAADDIALVGSPGAGEADHAGDLGVGADDVWVGSSSRDPVTYLANTGWVNLGPLSLGEDPSEDAFGAQRFRAEALDRAPWVSIGAHELLRLRVGVAVQPVVHRGRARGPRPARRAPVRPVVRRGPGPGVRP